MTAPLTTLAALLAASVPVFPGFEAPRFQDHDALIERCVREFNRHKGAWADANRAQARTIPDLTPDLVKAQMIQETGGGDGRSRLAWAFDPLQVNVPGDWTGAKGDLGLSKPLRRNEGRLEANIRAAIKFLVRKGFSRSGKPVRKVKEQEFGDWDQALKNYNGRRDKTRAGQAYSEAYAERIVERSESRTRHIPIIIR